MFSNIGSRLTSFRSSQTNPVTIAGWAYLVLGLSSTLWLLSTWGFSVAESGSGLQDVSTVAWAVAIGLLSIAGWTVLRRLGEVEGQLDELFC